MMAFLIEATGYESGHHPAGQSCVVGPDGFYLHEPVFDKELILEAELPVRDTIKEKMTLDVTGHYKRSDVFDFKVNKARNQ